MLSPKIRLNDELRENIQRGRQAKNISASDLSTLIGKALSYVSALENKRIAKVSSNDLVKIFSVIHDCSEEDAAEIIENLLEKNEIFDRQTAAASWEDDDTAKKPTAIKTYSLAENNDHGELHEKYIAAIDIRLRAFHKAHPHDALVIFQRLIKSMNFDLGFVMAILSAPFFNLEPLSHEERQAVYDEFADLLKKHFTAAQERAMEQPPEEEPVADE